MTRLPHDPGPHWGEVGIHGLHRAREWDTIALVDVGGRVDESETVGFVALPDGSYVAEGGTTGALSVFARAVELAPPFRAEAVHRGGSTWAVGARSILVAELPQSLLGDELELVWDGVERSGRVGGVPTLAWVDELEGLASAKYRTWVVRAARLRDDFWEVEIEPL